MNMKLKFDKNFQHHIHVSARLHLFTKIEIKKIGSNKINLLKNLAEN